MQIKTNKQLDSLQGHILVKKNYVMALQRRIALARIFFSRKTDYEKNEIEICVYEAQIKINNWSKSIAKDEQEFTILFNDFCLDLEELEKHYHAIIDLAKTSQSKNIQVRHLLHSVNWKRIDENIDEKIQLYKELKEVLKEFFITEIKK